MGDQNNESISVLNELIETCKDSEAGFKTAADGLQSSDIKAQFIEYARERGEMASQLQSEVRRLGGDPEQSGSMAGSLHRGWIDVKSAVTGHDDKAIVAEAERGEDAAKAVYQEALGKSLPGSTESVVRQQSAKVQRVHDTVRNLRDSYPTSS